MRIYIPFTVLLSAAVLAQTLSAPNAEALFEAARNGDRALVVALLAGGVDVNAQSRYGVTALGFAADKGHLDLVRLLLERGANVNVTDSFYGSRPIDFALRDGHTDVALYLLASGSQGAVGVLTAGIRRKDQALVKAALATDQPDAAALATASSLADQVGDPAIAVLVKTAAAAKPASAPSIIAVNPSVLRAYEGRYQSASTDATVTVAVAGRSLTLAAEGQPMLQLLPVEERRFTADNAPEVVVSFAGRGGMIERLVIARGTSSVRYEREGFGDATSPAPAVPEWTTATRATGTTAAGDAGPARKGAPVAGVPRRERGGGG